MVSHVVTILNSGMICCRQNRQNAFGILMFFFLDAVPPFDPHIFKLNGLSEDWPAVSGGSFDPQTKHEKKRSSFFNLQKKNNEDQLTH